MGWNKTLIPAILNGSALFILALDETNTPLGMGRLIGDGTSDCYLQDIVVFPDHRDRHIGTRIVSALQHLAALHGYTWTGLIAAPGKQTFYERTGFSPMTNYTPMLHEEK